MSEPTSAAAITLAAATSSVPPLMMLGVSLGLRPDVLLAGFSGALVAIILLNTVPPSGDTWRHLIGTTLRRMGVVLASSLTAGYITPAVLQVTAPADALLLGTAFAVGGGAQQVLRGLIRKLTPVETQ